MTDERLPSSVQYEQDVKAIAESIPPIPNDFAILRSLLARVHSPTQPTVKFAREGSINDALGAGGVAAKGDELSLVSDQRIGSVTGGSFGIVAKEFYGQTNLLNDPAFERVHDLNPFGTTDVDGVWRTRYVLNSGSAPGLRQRFTDDRGYDANPFNSASVRINLGSFSAGGGNTTVYLYPEPDYDGVISGAPPLLIAACKIADLGSTADVFTNITSATVRMQILNGAGTVVSESPPVSYVDISADRPNPHTIWTSYANSTAGFQADDWLWRLRIDVVNSGAGGSLSIVVAEPQLHFAYTPDPLPFAPVLGGWHPSYLEADMTTTGGVVMETKIRSDSQPRFRLTAGGTLEFGPGISGLDTTLRWFDANLLGTDDGFSIGRRLRFQPELSPAQITANQNDYNPTNFSTSTLIRLRSDATVRTITGMAAGAGGDLVILCNVNASTNIILSHQDAASAAANRFFGPNSADVTLRPGGFVWCVYDPVSTGWRIMGQ